MNKATLKPQIGLFSAVIIVLGNIVGVMIFLTPATVASYLPSTPLFLMAWIIGGIMALLGALSLGELGAMYPEAGGDYTYIRKAFGDKLSFLSGWTSVVITFPGSIAAMAAGISVYQAPFILGSSVKTEIFSISVGNWVLAPHGTEFLALGIIIFITLINHIGTKVSALAQTLILALPLFLMIIGAIASFFSGYTPPPVVEDSTANPLLGFFPALVPIFFAYAGWNVTTYIGSEIKNPGKNIARSLIIGTLAAVLVYVLVLLLFIKGVGVENMPKVPFVPAVAVSVLFGKSWGSVVVWVIALAVLSSLNATVMAGARISYSMSGNKLFPSSLNSVSSKFKTPAKALWLQCGIASMMVLAGGFEQLISFTVMVMLLFSIITVSALIVLRVKKPEVNRPYKTHLYPVTPIVFILFSSAVVLFLLYGEKTRMEALWGIIITLTGLPAYYFFKKTQR